MNDYFDVSEYQQYPWWGGHYEGGWMENTYQLFTIGKDDYLFLTLQWKPAEVGKQDVVD